MSDYRDWNPDIFPVDGDVGEDFAYAESQKSGINN